MTTLQERALRLYQAPFRYENGYIWDARNEMVADNHTEDTGGDLEEKTYRAILRIRGWGRISYMENAPELQDEVGRLVAQALTEFWNKHHR